jgi:Zn finger protein HypA/HybF involved in hydrogenase expression
MHDGCNGDFASGQDILTKIRTMGFNCQPMPAILTLNCENCTNSFQMETFECQCPACGMVYAVTPCHAGDPAAVRAAGVNV